MRGNTGADGAERVIAIVGAGPRGTSLLERIVANAEECGHGPGAVTVHMVDPFPPGGGRVWRSGQSPLMWMNTRAGECTLFVDESVDCSGPAVPGPDLAAWARALAAGTLPLPASFTPRPAALAEARRVHPGWFATRVLHSDYLSWVFWTVVERAAPHVRVRVHTDRAERLCDLADGGQRVRLACGGVVDADVVVLAQGIGDMRPGGEERALADHAAREKLYYLPRSFTADARLDTDLGEVRPGEPVLMRGMGLAFIDAVVLLAEGRGGRFEREDGGALRYRASGREPVIYAGSRRGVPFRAKFAVPAAEQADPPLRRLTGRALGTLGDGTLDFARDVRPLLLWELEDAGYRALAAAQPDRLAVDPAAFTPALDAAEWGTRERADLLAGALRHPADRIDFDSADRPLAGRRFAGIGPLQEWMRAHIAAGLERRSRRPSALDLAVYRMAVRLSHPLAELLGQGRIEAGSGAHSLTAFFDHARFLSSGPPARRMEEVLALSRAGVLRFLGADLEIAAGPSGFEARSSSCPARTEARALIEARLPAPDIEFLTDPLMARLREDGGFAGRGQLIGTDTSTARLLRADRTPHPRRYGAGAMVAGSVGTGQFAAPGTNAPSFRQNDEIARSALLGGREPGVRRRPAPDGAREGQATDPLRT